MKDPHLESFAATGLRFARVPRKDGYVTSGDARIHFAVFGVGSPVVLLHGGMGNSTHWAHQVEAVVASGRSAVVMDTRGHGRSTSGNRTFSYDLFAQDVLGLLDFLGLDRATLVGWSDGACTALVLARTFPARVSGVVFFACNVDPTGTLEFVMTKTIENCLTRNALDFQEMTPGLEDFRALQPKLGPMQKDEPNYGASELGEIVPRVAVLQSENDEFIRWEHAQHIANHLPHSSFETLKGVSHFAPVQDPELFNRVLLRHLDAFERERVPTPRTPVSSARAR